MRRSASRRTGGVFVALVLAVCVIAGCANTGYSASSAQRELQRAGLTATQARCVTNRMEDNFSPRDLAAHRMPTARQVATQRRVLESCGVSPRKPSAPTS